MLGRPIFGGIFVLANMKGYNQEGLIFGVRLYQGSSSTKELQLFGSGCTSSVCVVA